MGKAEQILQSGNAITAAPGEHKKPRMVLSYSQATPHHVQTKSNGQYVCDSACLQWASSQICSHTIAAAESNEELPFFLQWYTKYAESPNISTLAMSVKFTIAPVFTIPPAFTIPPPIGSSPGQRA